MRAAREATSAPRRSLTRASHCVCHRPCVGLSALLSAASAAKPPAATKGTVRQGEQWTGSERVDDHSTGRRRIPHAHSCRRCPAADPPRRCSRRYSRDSASRQGADHAMELIISSATPPEDAVMRACIAISGSGCSHRLCSCNLRSCAVSRNSSRPAPINTC